MKKKELRYCLLFKLKCLCSQGYITSGKMLAVQTWIQSQEEE